MEQQLALVVGRPSGAQYIAVNGRVERIGPPQLDRVDRLHVVMSVDDDSGRVAIMAAPLREYAGQPARGPDLDRREAGPLGCGREPFSAPRDVSVVLGLCADTRYSQPLIQIRQ